MLSDLKKQAVPISLAAIFALLSCGKSPAPDLGERQSPMQDPKEAASSPEVRASEKSAQRDPRHDGGRAHEGGHTHHIKHTPEEWAERLDNPERDGWQKPAALVEMLGISPGQTVAEVGAGTGYFLKYLSEAVGPTGRVLARDVEEDLVDYMKNRAKKEGLSNIEPARCGFDAPALPDGGVDRVLIVNTWHHISDRVAYGKTLIKTLSEEGALFVVDFTKESTVGPPPESKLRAEQVLDELRQAGFKASALPDALPQQYVIRAVRP